MPLQWTLESRLQLITVVAEGNVVRGDLEAYLARVSGVKLSDWRKLIDARDARLALTLAEVNMVGVRIRTADAARSIGALAFVTPDAADDPR